MSSKPGLWRNSDAFLFWAVSKQIVSQHWNFTDIRNAIDGNVVFQYHWNYRDPYTSERKLTLLDYGWELDIINDESVPVLC